MKKLIAAALCGLALSVSVAAPALADDTTWTPGYAEQRDGSDHGATGKAARKDPQPDKGKDCLQHGFRANGRSMTNGGVNEDHCAAKKPHTGS